MNNHLETEIQEAVDCWIVSKEYFIAFSREVRDNPTAENARLLAEAEEIEVQAKDLMALHISRLRLEDRTRILLKAYNQIRDFIKGGGKADCAAAVTLTAHPARTSNQKH